MMTERRRYFRIDDKVLIKYRVLQEDTVERERYAVYRNKIKAENARAALLGIDTRLEEVIAAIRYEHPMAAEALDLLNRKVVLLERVVALEGTHAEGAEVGPEHVPMDVNLSGGGIGITAETPLAVSAHLAIDIVLLPIHHPMRLFGQVVESRPTSDNRYRISVEFDDIRDRDRDLLVQHVMRKQSAALRLARRRPNPGGTAA